MHTSADTTLPGPLNGMLASSSVSGWDLGFAVASVAAAWIISIFAKRGLLSLLGRLQGMSAGAAILTARLVRYAILLVGIGVGFAFLGASIQPLIAVALIVAAVAVLALRGISANFAAGVILQTRHPLKVGDEIEVGSLAGTVRELNGRSVVLVTRDGKTVHTPNSLLLESPLVNHSELGRTRSDVEIRCAAGIDDLDTVTALVAQATHASLGVLPDPPVSILVRTAEPNRLTLLVRFWHEPPSARVTSDAVVRSTARALRHAQLEATTTSMLPVAPLTPPPLV